MMQKLSHVGWSIQGDEGGGQRTAAAIGVDEIRFPHAIDGGSGILVVRGFSAPPPYSPRM